MQSRSATDVFGIDVSRHQGVIDWTKAAAAGVKYVFIKATEGATYTDPNLQTYVAGAVGAGIPIGFYHYARPENNGAKTEAANFAKITSTYKPQFPLVLDVEGDAAKLGRANLTQWCLTFLQELKRLTGQDGMIYTGASFANSYLGPELGSYPLWIAHYNVTTPMANATWGTWSVFQYSSSGTVAGISGNVDMNAMVEAFYKKYTVEEEVLVLSAADANTIINFLKAGYNATTSPDARKEFNRLANELRKASGQPLE